MEPGLYKNGNGRAVIVMPDTITNQYVRVDYHITDYKGNPHISGFSLEAEDAFFTENRCQLRLRSDSRDIFRRVEAGQTVIISASHYSIRRGFDDQGKQTQPEIINEVMELRPEEVWDYEIALEDSDSYD